MGIQSHLYELVHSCCVHMCNCRYVYTRGNNQGEHGESCVMLWEKGPLRDVIFPVHKIVICCITLKETDSERKT